MRGKHMLHAILTGVLSLTLSLAAQAATITYAGDRPIEFTGLVVDGELFDVSVTWDGTFNDAYGTGVDYAAPYFAGDSAGATAATEAMMAALLDDGYTQATTTSYLTVVDSVDSTFFSGSAVWLHSDPLEIRRVNGTKDTAFGTVGYTHFTSLGPVPVPPAVWLFASGLLGLIGIARRRTHG
jgi:hypothetical protein